MALAAAWFASMAGCGSRQQAPAQQARTPQTQYQRIAIVCAPAAGANAKYAAVILDQAKAEANKVLGPYLKAADCLPDVAVDTTSTPPKADLGARAADYDAVCCLTYSHGGGKATLDFYVLDVKSGASVWTYKLDTADPDTHRRLSRHGHYVPAILKHEFYRFK